MTTLVTMTMEWNCSECSLLYLTQLDSRKTRGGSKEALKRKKKMYKARKRRLTWNKIPENSQVKYEALPPAVCKYYLMGTCSKVGVLNMKH